MAEYLAKRNGTIPALSREERMTRQFYDWEKRGRGWQVCSYPVDLEPPFRRVIFYDTSPKPIFDDGRIPTFWSKLLSGTPSVPRRDPAEPSEEEFLAYLAELDEPEACDYYDEEFIELQLILPKDQKVAKPFVDKLVTSATFCTNPISFEVIGTPKEVVVQMAATPRDLPQLRSQLAAYFPDARFRENGDSFLEFAWNDADGYEQIVDFGLSNEFMIPLDTVSNLDLDPLISVIGALNVLETGEVGVFQILFQKVRSNWGPEIRDSVMLETGKPVFSDAPELVKYASQKVSSQLYAAVIRVAAKAYDRERVWQIVRGSSAGMSQLSTPNSNELIPLTNQDYDREHHELALLRRLSFRVGMILNLDELVSLVHPPSITVRSEKLTRDMADTKAAPALTRGHAFVLGENAHHQATATVSLSNDQRTRHIHLIGSSGSGKSTLLLSLINQDLEKGDGICVIDPHGDLIENVIENIPEGRLNDVILFDPSDSEFPIGFNILQARSPLEKSILSSDLIATFRRMSTSWGDVMDSVLANAILAFIESSRGGTLFDLKRFLVEKEFREEFLPSINDQAVRYFWEYEFEHLSGKPSSSILIRLDAFLRQSLIRNIVCQKENKLDFRGIMDGRKILLIKLSQGLIGEENAYLLGTMLVSRLYQSALSRQDSHDRPYFWLYLDEFHHFITPSMERILAGTRKYNLGLVLAHQEFRQMQARSQEVASSVLSNCYTRICFRLGDADSSKFADGFSFFDSKSLQNLGIGEAIARVERADYDFNLSVTPVPDVARGLAKERSETVVRSSRQRFARTRPEIEREIDFDRPKRRAPEPEPPRTSNRPQQKEGRNDNVGDTTKRESPEPKPRQKDAPSEHGYLQTLLKRIGEDHGFVATIEMPVFGGIGRVDVALERDDIRVACEVADTNATEYEILNIQKCLMAGFDRMAVISTEAAHLKNIRKRAEVILPGELIERTHFIAPENFHLFLQSLTIINPPVPEEAEKVKGYEVKVTVKDTPTAEDSGKRGVIRDLLSRVARRRKKNKE
ncbi:MAG: type IV secretion system DNA-binding domain-containing protein [Pyrinomonadaceae bacterium]